MKVYPELSALGPLVAAKRSEAGHQWFWDGHEHVDPAKEATAQSTRLASHTTMLATEYARQGKDWEVELRQAAREAALMKELGLTMGDAQAPTDEPDADAHERC